MTIQSRKKITKQILTNNEDAASTTTYDNAITDIETKLDDDKVNREEFIYLNKKITCYKTELMNSAGISSSTDFSMPITEVTYYTDSNHTFSSQDNIEMWKAAKLDTDNIFYVPVVANSEKLVFDVTKQTDSDGTTNVEPIMPASFSPSFSTIDQYNEKTTMTLLTWAKAVYTNGYSLSCPTFSVEDTAFGTKLYYLLEQPTPDDPGYFTVGNNIWFENGGKYALGEVKTKGIEGGSLNYDFFITIELKITIPMTGTIYFSENIPALSDISKNILKSIVNYWISLLTTQRETLQNIPEITSLDSPQIALIGATINHLNIWVELSEIDKFVDTNLNNLVSIFPTRLAEITTRTNYISGILNTILSDRETIIKLRLRKRSGTLNSVYREILSMNTSSDKTTTDYLSYLYFKDKFIVKRILSDATDTKVIFVSESASLAINDLVYIISDSTNLLETKTYIKDIVSSFKESTTELALEPVLVPVKKITLANSISSLFLYSDNIRIVKQLIE